MLKKKIVANWKMNGSLKFLEEFLDAFKEKESDKYEVVICPSFVHLNALKMHLASRQNQILMGAQDVSAQLSGAFTGDVSIGMLCELGVSHVIVGHSERRLHQGETNKTVAFKFRHCIDHQVVPIVCVGESLEQRNTGQTEVVIIEQLLLIAQLVKELNISFDCFAVAYEPVWAIGTGVAATESDIATVHAKIKSIFGISNGLNACVLYGGSVKPDNAQSIAKLNDVDGFLVGGASLNALVFAGIAQSFV